ncbi:MAG: hypothetical protein C5B49_02575 [Bdellovibrio sp.]|nr:MAG: hypothetical protein C5B49_02575 [Bdellovibrio sp.]
MTKVKMIEQIANELESLPDEVAATKVSENFTNGQRPLVEFIFATMKDCSPEAQEIGFFIALVLWSYFSRIGKLKSVREEGIMEKFDKATSEMQAYEGGDESALSAILPDEVPNDEVLVFIMKELELARRDGDLIMDEVGTLYTTLKVVAECLADAETTKGQSDET